MSALPGLGPLGVKAGLSRVRWSLGRRGAVCVSGLASTLGCVGIDVIQKRLNKPHIGFIIAFTLCSRESVKVIPSELVMHFLFKSLMLLTFVVNEVVCMFSFTT